MADRKSLSTRRGRESAPRKDFDKALKDVTEGEKKKRVPYDTSPDVHRKLAGMRVNSRDNVPVRSFLDEAVADLFEKYRRGEGHYQVDNIDRILGD